MQFFASETDWNSHQSVGFRRITERGVQEITFFFFFPSFLHTIDGGSLFGDGRFGRAVFTVEGRSPLLPSVPLIQLSKRLAGKRNFRLSVFANQLPSPGQKTDQAAINYKEILSSCGRFASTLVSKANRYGVLGSSAHCTAAIPNPGPQILLQQIRESGEEGRWVICTLQHHNSHSIFISRPPN